MKCKSEDDCSSSSSSKGKCPVLGETYILPPWRSQYIVEPAPFGGRNTAVSKKETSSHQKLPSGSVPVYAQEIAALPLERLVADSSSRGRSKTTLRSKYDGMLLHTNLCNELVCQPKMLQDCFRKNIAIKVEVRELQWNEALSAEIAVPVAPSIHNTRRGPWLVKDAFTSCAMGTAQFLDEFKVKLPLALGSGGRRLALLFTVYHLNDKPQSNKPKRRSPSFLREDISEDVPQTGYSLERLGSGFLPLTLDNCPSCLITNGDHEVPIKFRATEVTDKRDNASSPSPSAPTHKKQFSFGDRIGRHVRSWSLNSDNQEILAATSMDGTNELDQKSPPALFVDEKYPEGSVALSPLNAPLSNGDAQEDDKNTDDGSLPSSSGGSSIRAGFRTVSSFGDLKRLGSQEESQKDPVEFEEMTLQVTIIAFSSVHPQNKTLADLFLTKPKPPRPLIESDFSEPYSPWGKYRSEIIYRLKPERIPPFNFVGGALAETERKLLEPVVSLTKSSKCPHSDLMAHLIRVVAQLWRTTVSGAGEPSILWAR